MATTLQEIAERLNVSTATVSRVLNGKPGVAQKTRERVLAVAHELNFSPNPAAKSLVTSNTYAIAFVIKRWLVGVENPFYDRIMLGVEQELEKHGYHLVSITIDESRPGDEWMPPGLDPRRLDGLIIAGCELSNRVMMTLLSMDLPTILAANILPHMNYDAVSSDNKEGGYLATRHLIEHGHKEIVFLCGPQEWSPVCERLHGYEEAIREYGLNPNIEYMPDLEIESGALAFRNAREKNPNISAVFGSNDPMAIGAMQAAQDMGLKIPDDVAVIGFDNIPWSENTNPPLTTIYIHKEQIGKLAARRLLEKINEGSESPMITRVGNELVLRRSCGCEFSNGT